MGMGSKRHLGVSFAEEAVAKRTAFLVGEQMRHALYEDRMIRSGQHREYTAEEAAALREHG